MCRRQAKQAGGRVLDPGNESLHWSFDLGINVANFDWNSTPNGTIFEGVTDAQAYIFGNHLDPPHSEANNQLFQSTGKTRTSAPNTNLRLMASGSEKHGSNPHRDRYSTQYRFRVQEDSTPPDSTFPDPLVPINTGVDNIKIDARHPGSGPKVPTGRTVGATGTSVAYFASSGNMLILNQGSIDIVSDTPTTVAGTGSYASDAVVGSTLPGVVAQYAGLANGVHTFTPLGGSDEIMLTAGDSYLHAAFEGVTIDATTGEGQVQFTTTSYTETYGGTGDNPSNFMGALTSVPTFSR